MLISKEESSGINSLRFFCIVFLVLLHTHTEHLVNDSIRANVENVQNFGSVPFLQILFIMSGYLFFVGINLMGGAFPREIYNKKLTKRISSLLIPYILWGIISIVYQYIAKHKPLPVGVQWITWFWDVGSGHPIGMALWYVKSLIVFSILSPLYFIAVKIFGHFTLIIVLLLSAFHLPIDFPWFNVYLLLGCYIALHGYSLLKIAKLFDWRVCLSIYVMLKLAVAFFDMPIFSEWVSIVSLSCGLLYLFSNHPLPSSLCVTSSFVYFAHPYFTGIRNLLMTVEAKDSVAMAVGIWLLTAICVFTVCVFIFFILKKFSPKLLGVLSGGRV